MEADTTMTLQGGVRQSTFGYCSFVLAYILLSLPPVRAEIELKNYILIAYMRCQKCVQTG